MVIGGSSEKGNELLIASWTAITLSMIIAPALPFHSVGALNSRIK